MTLTQIKQPTKINAYKVLELIDWLRDDFTNDWETCEIKDVDINESTGIISINATLDNENNTENYSTLEWHVTAEMVNSWENHTDHFKTYHS